MPTDRTRWKATARRGQEARRAVGAAARASVQRRSRTFLGAICGAVAVLVAVIVVGVVQNQRTAVSADAATPANTVAEAGVRFGDPDAPVTVHVYEDFLRPASKSFEDTLGATLTGLVTEGAAVVEYRPVAIVDHASTDACSTRALNAAAVVTDTAGTDAFLAFHELLFTQQPAEGGAGLSDDQLIALAERASAAGEQVEAGIRDRAFEDRTRRVTDQASRDGLTGTPTVLADGEVLDARTPQGLRDAVPAAAG